MSPFFEFSLGKFRLDHFEKINFENKVCKNSIATIDFNLIEEKLNMMEPKITDDHDVIVEWVERRDGRPALVDQIADKNTEDKLLRIDFMDNATEGLYQISWDKFFEIFDEHNLRFWYLDIEDTKEPGKLCKIVKNHEV